MRKCNGSLKTMLVITLAASMTFTACGSQVASTDTTNLVDESVPMASGAKGEVKEDVQETQAASEEENKEATVDSKTEKKAAKQAKKAQKAAAKEEKKEQKAEEKAEKKQEKEEEKGGTVAPVPTPVKPDLDLSAYNLVWADEFEGTELDRTAWNVELHNPGWVNSELQAYVDSSENIKVENGELVITPIETIAEDGSKSYTSGRINTQNKETYTYGVFEVRAKVPAGKGYLPAFWLMANDENVYGQWPRCGEIDCMEVMGQDTKKVYGTIHYGNPHSESQGTKVLTSGSFADEYHTFTTEWEPGKITWYVDGIKYHEESDWYSTNEGVGTLSYPAPFDQPFYIILNLAVGGSWVGYPDADTKFGEDAQYCVDYVRVYQKDAYDENVKKPVKVVELRDADATGNYIKNGAFASDADWTFLTANGGVGSAKTVDGQMVIETTDAGTVDYSIQLVQADLPFEKGATYRVSFDAYASEAREMNVDVKAPDHGYKTYKDTLKAQLTTTSQTFTQEFKMTSDSDANGRLEFNMGNAGSTATIYIDNVRVEKIQDADPDEVEAKTVLADGNFIYNGSFQEGEGHLGSWEVTPADAVRVTNFADGRRAAVTVSEGKDVIFEQRDLALASEGKYEFSFDAQAMDGADVTVTAMVGGQEYNFTIAGEKKTYSAKLVRGAMARMVPNNDVTLIISGNGEVRIDNIRLVEDALIKNGSFNAGLAGFEVYKNDAATASCTVDSISEDNAFDATIDKTGDQEWYIQLKQSNVALESGHYYKLSFNVKSDLARSIQYSIQRDGSVHKNADGSEDWTPYAQATVKLAGDSQYQLVENYFQMEQATDLGSIFNIAMGGGNITTQHRICIDNIDLIEITEDEMPKEETPSQNVGENLLTNVDFANGFENWVAKMYAPAAGSWAIVDGKAVVTITNPGDATWQVGLQQSDITFAQGCTYQFSAKLKSNVDRHIEFSSMDATSNKWYVQGENQIDLVAGEELTYTANINVGANKTDKTGYVAFNLGKNAPAESVIEISDLSLVLVSGTPVVEEEEEETPQAPELPVASNGVVLFEGSEEINDWGKRWEIPNLDWATINEGAKLTVTATMIDGLTGDDAYAAFHMLDTSWKQVITDIGFDYVAGGTQVKTITLTKEQIAAGPLGIQGHGFVINKVEFENAKVAKVLFEGEQEINDWGNQFLVPDTASLEADSVLVIEATIIPDLPVGDNYASFHLNRYNTWETHVISDIGWDYGNPEKQVKEIPLTQDMIDKIGEAGIGIQGHGFVIKKITLK